MSLRIAARRVVASVAATAAVGTLALVAFSAPAGAVGPTSGSTVPGAATPVPPFTPGTPFDSGQSIKVVIPTNSTFNGSHAAINIVECAAPNGVIPSNPIACDGNTIQGNSILPAADGSFTYTGYTLYALPDLPSLGEGPGGPVCGNTAATECVLYIGNNQNDFTQPHLWSAPFKITANGNDLGANPGDGTPEVPLAIILPLSAMGLLGAAVLIRRRRAAHTA